MSFLSKKKNDLLEDFLDGQKKNLVLSKINHNYNGSPFFAVRKITWNINVTYINKLFYIVNIITWETLILFSEFDPCGYVYQAWKGKEMLFEAIEKKTMKKIDELIKYFWKSVHYKIVTVWKTLKKRREEIQNYFDKQITNAFTEWKNTKAKLFKRMAYGYKKKENYMKRLLICL